MPAPIRPVLLIVGKSSAQHYGIYRTAQKIASQINVLRLVSRNFRAIMYMEFKEVSARMTY